MLLIDGKLSRSKGKKSFPIINPATGQQIAEASEASTEDVDQAVSVAARAQKEWSKVKARERGKLLMACANLLQEHTDELALLMTLETGKAIRTESRLEAGVFTDMLTFYGGLASELKGETVPYDSNMLVYTTREPLGVVGAIIPWNVPLLLMAMKIAPAIVAGNTVVLKSAEEAPLSVLRAAEIMNTILPPGVLNVLSGFGEPTGAALVSHPDVKKVSFTGSVEVGRIVYKSAAEKLVPVTLELGGKSPMIVCADADLDKAVEGAVIGMRFTRQGQSCSAASRMFIHESLHDQFVERLKEKVDAMIMGNPFDERTDIGSIISPGQYEKVKAYIEKGLNLEGVTAHECSQMPEDPAVKDGLFIRPVLFTGIQNDSPLAQEEIFGPVACIIKWTDLDQVMSDANGTDYGLAGTIWTQDLKTALRGVEQLEAGFVQVNQNLVVQPNLSYGGVKNSGLGREASLEAMLEHFTQKKTVLINLE